MLIKNGFLIDPASDTERLVDLRITDGLTRHSQMPGTLTPEMERMSLMLQDL